MNSLKMIITIHSSVVYLVVVLILLPTSSLLIYSVSYISYCTSTHCHLLLIYFRTVSWIPVPSDADVYVVNATNNTHTMTQQVKGGTQNETTLKGLMPTTTYNITIRVYQDILGPVSNTTSVQTLISRIYFTEVYFNFCFVI